MPLVCVVLATSRSARASRSNNPRARRAPCCGETTRVRAVHRAYQLCAEVTGSSKGSFTANAGPTRANAGAARPGGNAGIPSSRLRPYQIRYLLPSSRWYRSNHGCVTAPRSRRCSRVPRTHATSHCSVTMPIASSRLCWPSASFSTERAMVANRDAGNPSTAATTLPVCSSVRPIREARPNSITASNSNRRRTRVRDCALGFSACQNDRKYGRDANSGGSSRYRAKTIMPSPPDRLVHQHVQPHRTVFSGSSQHRPQGQRMRTALHEPSPMSGILNAVGEDQRLFFSS